MRPSQQFGIVGGIKSQASATQPFDLSSPQRRYALSPLGNSALGDVQLPRNFSAGAEELDSVIGEHARKFSALDTKCKTAEHAPAVGYLPMNETRGNRIKYLRKSRRLTQQQLADEIGVTKGLVSQWENDQIEKISHPNWMGLLRVLHTDPDFLEFGPDQPRPPVEGAGRWRKRPG